MHIRHYRRSSLRRLHGEGEEKRGWKGGSLEGRQLSGPVTLTVTTVVRGSSNTPTPIATLPTTTDSLLPPLAASTETSSTPTTLFSIVAQPTPPPPVASPTVPSASPSNTPSVQKVPDLGENAATSNPVTLSSGAIVGIVIGCLVVLLVAVLVGLRKRTVRNRLKLRGVWAHSKAMGLRGSLRPTPYTYNAPEDSTLNGSMGFTGQPVSTKTTINEAVAVSSPQPLPSAYGADFDPSSAGSSPRAPVLYTAYVARSFVISLPDELPISIGQMVKVLQVFDDGWAECMALDGETGMVPLECFEKRSGDGAGLSPKISASSLNEEEIPRNSKRFSSLPRARQ